jgi:hypothetical protein
MKRFGDLPMLTFEFDNDEKLCVHGDPQGLRSLCRIIRGLIEHTPAGEFDHAHLMTPAWGGSELTAEPQDSEARLIHHVKFYCWNGSAT